MIDPVSISAIIIASVSALGAIVIGIIQALRGGFNCSAASCLTSDCCSSTQNTKNDIHDNKEVIIN